MMVFPVLAVSFVMKVVAALFIISAVTMILVILIQKGKGGGLSSAFGGGMASGLLGSKTGDFLTWVTISLVGAFLVLAVLMAKFYKPTVSDFGDKTTTQQQQSQQPQLPQQPPQTEQPMTSDVNAAK